MSGVTVATTITSTSLASMPRAARHRRAASAPRSLVATPLSTMCRSRIPVRSVIHLSLVATIVSRSALVSSRGGTYVPTELIFTLTLSCAFNVKLNPSPRCLFWTNSAPNHSLRPAPQEQVPVTIRLSS